MAALARGRSAACSSNLLSAHPRLPVGAAAARTRRPSVPFSQCSTRSPRTTIRAWFHSPAGLHDPARRGVQAVAGPGGVSGFAPVRVTCVVQHLHLGAALPDVLQLGGFADAVEDPAVASRRPPSIPASSSKSRNTSSVTMSPRLRDPGERAVLHLPAGRQAGTLEAPPSSRALTVEEEPPAGALLISRQHGRLRGGRSAGAGDRSRHETGREDSPGRSAAHGHLRTASLVVELAKS